MGGATARAPDAAGRSVAVVGAGPAGAVCARLLTDAGLAVTVFDKARGPGGRTSTRRDGGGRCDHGAQYVTFRHPAMAPWLARWQAAGVLVPWDGPFAKAAPGRSTPHRPRRTRFVAVPGMNGLVKHLLRGVTTRFGTRVSAIADRDGWTVADPGGPLGRFDRVLVTVPAPQAVPLLAARPDLAAAMATVRIAPCWAVIVDGPDLDPGWSGAKVDGSPLAWVCRNHTKPGRTGPPRWLLHATPDWSTAHLDDAADEVGPALVAAARALPGLADLSADRVAAHRWRYALVTEAVGAPCLYTDGLGVAGDGLLGGKLEAALRSGVALAERVLAD